MVSFRHPFFALVASWVTVACSTDSSDPVDTSSESDGGPPTPSMPNESVRDDDDAGTNESPADGDDSVTFGPGGTVVEGPVAPTATAQEPEPPAAPLMRCADAVGTGGDPLIDDFEDRNLESLERDGRAGGWYRYNSDGDEVGHDLSIEPVDESRVDQQYALHTSGAGYLWAGVGAGLRWGTVGPTGEWVECVYDASAYDGVRFWAWGNELQTRLTLSVPAVIPVEEGGTCEVNCWGNHGFDMTIHEGWHEYFVPFSSFEQPTTAVRVGALDPSVLRSFQFEMPSGSAFELLIDEIGFYSGMPAADLDAGVADSDAAVQVQDAGPVEDAAVEVVDVGDAAVEETGDAG